MMLRVKTTVATCNKLLFPTRLSPGSLKYYPWRCLKRGFFLLTTYSFPFLRTILQSTLRFLMDALTFITIFFFREPISFTCLNLTSVRIWILPNIYSRLSQLFIPENYPPSRQVIRAHFHAHLITRQNSYVIHPHFT